MDDFNTVTLRRPTRKEKILAGLDTSGLGLEIGASINPLVRPDMGLRCKVLDHLDRDGLIEKYEGHEAVDGICQVDYVWSGQPYAELVGNERFDWIVASHVIEHCPDVIGFIKDCSSILTENGVLSLVIPDKRYAFDALRPPTGLAQIIDAHLTGAKRPSGGAIGEFCLYAVHMAGEHAWSDKTPIGAQTFAGDLPGLMDLIKAVNDGEYRDIHVSTFTPSSFRLIVENLFGLGFIDLREAEFFDTEGNEFFVRLSRRGPGPDRSRLNLAQRAAREAF